MSDWERFKNKWGVCSICREKGLLAEGAKPLFMNWEPEAGGILFVWKSADPRDVEIENPHITLAGEAPDEGGQILGYWLDLFFCNDLARIVITNSVLCSTKKDVSADGFKEQQILCSRHLRDLIVKFEPKIVCPLGQDALSALHEIERPESGGIPLSRGTVKECVAKAYDWYGRILFPLYMPHNQVFSGNRTEEEQVCDWAALRRLWDANASSN